MAAANRGSISTGKGVFVGGFIIVGLFVIFCGLGMTNLAISGLGLIIAVLGPAFVMLQNLRGPRDANYGTAYVSDVVPRDPITLGNVDSGDLTLVVRTEGTDGEGVRIQLHDPAIPVAKWPRVGSRLPVIVSADNPYQLRVLWNEVTAPVAAGNAGFESGSPDSGLDTLIPPGPVLRIDDTTPTLDNIPVITDPILDDRPVTVSRVETHASVRTGHRAEPMPTGGQPSVLLTEPPSEPGNGRIADPAGGQTADPLTGRATDAVAGRAAGAANNRLSKAGNGRVTEPKPSPPTGTDTGTRAPAGNEHPKTPPSASAEALTEDAPPTGAADKSPDRAEDARQSDSLRVDSSGLFAAQQAPPGSAPAQSAPSPEPGGSSPRRSPRPRFSPEGSPDPQERPAGRPSPYPKQDNERPTPIPRQQFSTPTAPTPTAQTPTAPTPTAQTPTAPSPTTQTPTAPPPTRSTRPAPVRPESADEPVNPYVAEIYDADAYQGDLYRPGADHDKDLADQTDAEIVDSEVIEGDIVDAGDEVPVDSSGGVSVTLLVSDLDRSRAFYRDLLGLREVGAARTSAVMAFGDARVVLRRVISMPPIDRRVVHLNLDVADVQETYERLSAKGIEFVHRPREVRHGENLRVCSATFHDPDGHSIALTRWTIKP